MWNENPIPHTQEQQQPKPQPQDASSLVVSNNNVVDESSEIVDTVERILFAYETRTLEKKSESSTSANKVGKLSQNELNDLSLLCSTTAASKTSPSCSSTLSYSKEKAPNWSMVDFELLSTLLSLLQDHVNIANSVDLILDARSDFDQGNQITHIGFDQLRQGLEAASIILSIMITPGVSRQIIYDDAIEACVSLIRHHITRHIIPSLSSTGHTLAYAPEQEKKNKSNQENDDEIIEDVPDKKTQRKRKRDSVDDDATHLESFLKVVYKPIVVSVGSLCLLMEKVDQLIQHIQVEDQILLSLSATALSTLSIEPTTSKSNMSFQIHIVQQSSIKVVSTIFRQYTRHRRLIIQDLFPICLKLPTKPKFLRTYPIIGTAQNTLQGSSKLGDGNFCKTSAIVSPINRRDNSDDGQSNIQMITALLLHMFQGCVTMPEAITERGTAPTKSGLEICEAECKFFTEQLIIRCAKKGGEGGASEFRPFLGNLVEDLVRVQIFPEFPAAEMLLYEICHRLCEDLISLCADENKNSSSNLFEVTFLATAMDTVGTICADIASKRLSSREKPLGFPSLQDASREEKNDEDLSENKEENRCFCGRSSLVDTFMLDCDQCHNWFHGSCVGIAKDHLPEIWTCDDCTIQQLITEKVHRYTHRSSESSTTDTLEKDEQTQIIRILFFDYLNRYLDNSSDRDRVRRFYVAKFIKDIDELTQKSSSGKESSNMLDLSLVRNHFLSTWDLSTTGTSNHHNDFSGFQLIADKREYFLSKEGISKITLSLFTSASKLALSFGRILAVFLALVNHEKIASVRKLAVKAIAQVVQVDRSLMLQQNIRTAIGKRFQDDAISVREATVSLVGIYILQVPSIAKVFYSALLERLHDEGVSVRKRVVKIFRDVLISDPEFAGRAVICTNLLQRLAQPKEDDGVRDLIHETFHTIWFENSNDRVSKTLDEPKYDQLNSSAAIVTPISNTRSQSSSLRNGSYSTAQQIVDVVCFAKSPDLLSGLIKELFLDSSNKDKSNKTEDRKQRILNSGARCENIVAALVELLISFEEKRSSRDTSADVGPMLVALMSTLSIFAEAYPRLLVKDFDTLLPYLKADNGVSKDWEASIAFYVCKILSFVSPSLSQYDVQRLGVGSLSDDLVNITYNFGSRAMSAAVEAHAKLATYTDPSNKVISSKLFQSTKTFYSCLFKMKDAVSDISNVKARVRNNLHRALSALGLICRFLDKSDQKYQHDDVIDMDTIVDPSELTWENLPTSAYSLFHHYLCNYDTSTKCTALKAMSGIFLSHPRILLEAQQRGTLNKIMANGENPDLQLEALKCWCDILESEEKRVESGEAKRQMESREQISLSKRISGDQDGDASLIGACCIQHANCLLEMTSSFLTDIRWNALLVIEILLRQGLMNPIETVPHLIALQGDILEPNMRSKALKLLISEGEKRPDIIRQRLVSGIHLSYLFQKAIYPDSRITALMRSKSSDGSLRIDCIFDEIFKELIRGSRTHSSKVLSSLLSIFSFEFNGKKTMTQENKISTKLTDDISSFVNKIPLICFASEIIAHLPYNHLGDVLFLVHKISEMISVQGSELMFKFVECVACLGTLNEKDSSDEDFLELLANRNDPKAYKRLLVDCKKCRFDVPYFMELCAQSTPIILLLRLKLYLRQVYSGITDARIAEYIPNQKERITDRGITRNEASEFNSDVIFKREKVSSLDMKILIGHYSEFRSMMRSALEI